MSCVALNLRKVNIGQFYNSRTPSKACGYLFVY